MNLLQDAGLSTEPEQQSACGAEASAEQPSKKTRLVQRELQEVENLKKMVVILSKLELSSQLAARVHRAIVIDCYQAETEDKYIKAHRAGTQNYTAAAKRCSVGGRTEACGQSEQRFLDYIARQFGHTESQSPRAPGGLGEKMGMAFGNRRGSGRRHLEETNANESCVQVVQRHWQFDSRPSRESFRQRGNLIS